MKDARPTRSDGTPKKLAERKWAAVLIAAVASAVVSTGCGVQTIRVQRMKPAEVNLARYKTVAVAAISGPGGRAFADVLTQALFDSGRFQVVDRQNLERVLN